MTAAVDRRVLIALSIVLYIVTFPWVRTLVGDVVGAVSSVPVLIAGSVLSRKKTWLVGLAMVLVNGLMFSVTEVAVERNSEWQSAALGALMLLVTAELMGRVRDGAHRLERSGESKDRFLAGVSHELRTPLTAVVGYASILKSTWPQLAPDEREELVDVLHQQSGEVANIVEDLVVATRLDTGELTFAIDRVLVSREVSAVLSSLSVPPGKDVEVSVPPDLEIMADAGRVRQILRNLISNAFRYGGPRVSVEALELGSRVQIRVHDDGGGLSKGEWDSIFASYYRSHTAAGQPDSLGIGLTVSRRLARRMDGDLVYEAVAGESRFVLSLPRAQV